MKAINLSLLIIGLLGLTGCKTETITESSFWQMLPFTGSRSEPSKAQSVSGQPAPVVITKTPAAKPVAAPIKPAPTASPVTAVAQVEQPVVSTKKTKKLPPATAISLPVTPSKKSSVTPASNSEQKANSSASTDPTTPAPPATSFPLSDWLYDEKTHEQWRQKQLEAAQDKAPRHQYESAQLNRAFYNIILNEPTPAPTTETAKP